MDKSDREAVWLATLLTIGLIFVPQVSGVAQGILIFLAAIGITAIALDYWQ